MNSNNSKTTTFMVHDCEYKINEKLGEGAYGDVYEYRTKSDDSIAVKCIPFKKNGLPCLIEASIMSSVKHKHINASHDIQVSDNNLYIMQEKALCDFHTLTRRDKRNGMFNINTIKKWAYDILQGLDCLHSQGIVHGDVKSSNILLTEDNVVKLADFTLSIKIDKNNFPNHPVCTVTHRPLEALLLKEWSFPIDIWAYGCTLYEIAYGELIFPYQGDEPIDKSWKAINAILEWREETSSPLYKDGIDFKRVKYTKEYFHPMMTQFNRFIHDILRIHPSDRPNVKMLLKHPFFHSVTTFPYIYVYPKTQKLTDVENEMVKGWLQRNISSEKIRELIYTLYTRCQELELDAFQKLEACTSIACKLFHVSCHKYDNITENEIKVCTHLNYRLHW